MSQKIFEVKFTTAGINYVLNALGDKPYNECAALISEIQQQVIEQSKEKEEEDKSDG